MGAVQLVRLVGTVLCVLGIVLCWKVGRKKSARLSTGDRVSLGFAVVSAAALGNLLAFASLVVLPAATLSVGNVQTFAGVHQVQACARCHIMLPMVNDMKDLASDTLAARHFRNRWIPRDQCFNCHSNYGLHGDLDAMAEGFRHLARYTTNTYTEPIRFRGRFDNADCLKCHGGAPQFEAVQSHQTVRKLLNQSAMSCLNCHGTAHPTRAQRTPGSADYARLMEPVP
jgi:hypothetical protein